MTAKTPVEVSWPHLAAAFALGALCHAAAVPVLRRLVRLRPSFNRTPKAVKNTVALNASEPMRKVVCFDNAARLAGQLRELLPQSWKVVCSSSSEDPGEHADAIAMVASTGYTLIIA